MFIDLSERVSVAPQLQPGDVAAAKAAGFVLIINNRPDDEAPGQPSAAAIAAAAADAGVGYTHIPMTHGGVTPDMIDAVRKALAGDERVLLFCRSGARSTMLWALAEASAGKDPGSLAETARTAGFDLSPIAGVMRRLAGG